MSAQPIKPERDGAGLRFLYHTAAGRVLLKLLTTRTLSVWTGRFMDSPLSRPMIKGFARKNGIDLSEYQGAPYACFNDFFCRPIRPELRPLPDDPRALFAPCDGLLSAYRISGDTVLPVKQSAYNVHELLDGDPIAKQFEDGICLVFRLCVHHYHRYCYPDSGCKGSNTFIPGLLHTVRPIALHREPVFVRNCREYTAMQTDHFGPVVQMEVGAMLVGRIVNHHGPCRIERGQEKGCFQYGGSTVVLLLRQDAVHVSDALFEATAQGYETPVRMGEIIGMSTPD